MRSRMLTKAHLSFVVRPAQILSSIPKRLRHYHLDHSRVWESVQHGCSALPLFSQRLYPFDAVNLHSYQISAWNVGSRARMIGEIESSNSKPSSVKMVLYRLTVIFTPASARLRSSTSISAALLMSCLSASLSKVFVWFDSNLIFIGFSVG